MVVERVGMAEMCPLHRAKSGTIWKMAALQDAQWLLENAGG